MSTKRRDFSHAKFFNLSRDLLCIAGTDGYFKLVNPAFEHTLGWSTDELLRRPFFSFIHPDDLEATQREVEKLAQGIPTIAFENRYRCADGSYKHLHWTSQPEPETGLLYAVARDVSESKRIAAELVTAKEAAEQADRAKTHFLASMSHEIRSPMNGILGMADLAIERNTDPDLHPHLEIIRQSAEALVALMGEILDLAKVEAGKIELEERPFGLRSVLHAAVKMLAAQAHRKQLELLLRVAPEVPDPWIGDAGRLRQIVVNLLSNAIRFTDRGEVELEIEMSSGASATPELHFAVRDTGSGIPEELQPHVFDRFWQRRSPGGEQGGAGLGLAIAAQLVELMDGSIWLESQVGKGSTFYFTARLHLDRDSGARAEGHELAGQRVHLVIGQPRGRQILEELLRSWGMKVTTSADGAELAFAEGEAPAVCVVDCERSSAHGPDAVAQIQERLGSGPAIVALLDPVPPPEDLRRCRELGVAAHLLKPVGELELRRVLRQSLGLEQPPERERAAADIALRPLRVLVAEDSLVNQDVARGLLEARGHRVAVVGDGFEALAAATEEHFDLVLMDLQMPGLDGLEATRRIRAREQELGRPRVPIVALTAHALSGDRERCLGAGMDDYLAKPVRAQQLYQMLARFTPVRVPADGDAVASSLVDWDEARRITGQQPDLLERIAGAAIEELPKLARAARAAARARDLEGVRRGLHGLKGVLGYFGARPLVEELERLGRAARAQDLETVASRLGALESRIGVLIGELEAHLGAGGRP